MMEKLFELEPVLVDEMPKETEHGKLYISHKFGVAIHKCCCGCGVESVSDFSPMWENGWTLSNINGKYTLSPSIGNFNGEQPYHAHYFIVENKVVWC